MWNRKENRGRTQFSVGMFLHAPKSTRWSQQVLKEKKKQAAIVKYVTHFYHTKRNRATE